MTFFEFTEIQKYSQVKTKFIPLFNEPSVAAWLLAFYQQQKHGGKKNPFRGFSEKQGEGDLILSTLDTNLSSRTS